MLKKATVSAWSVSLRHPIKPPSFAHALVAQKPDIDKLIMKLAKQVALCGGANSDKQPNSIIDYIYMVSLNVQKKVARQPRSTLSLMTEFFI